ncbi:recombinase family protein [Pseudomonas sp. MWU13-2100]|uniref:recombinase family protein n=1 Tax=Pseudomonas sp. MWU13-2100 TaxID=2935075 RepID=UPI00200F8C9A|nr:recombinase family protein [Pseudomonas sp. MWU13-2100]
MQKKQAISYVRFSSARQRDGSSVERQEGMIAEWMRKNEDDYELSKLSFKDLGKSGFHGEHIEKGGGFGKLLVAVEQGAIKDGAVVLVEALDRTGRLEPLEMLTQVIAPILKAGVSIITLDDGTEYTKASVGGTQIFLLVAKIQAAHGYSETLSRRVTASYAKRRDKARTEGVTPERITPVWLNSDGTVRDEIVPWIKTAFELYVSGMGKATIAKRMRDSGVERLAKCSGPTVEGWLRNKAVIGKWETLAGTPDHQIIDAIYPEVIEPSLFYKAQTHAEDVKTKRPAKTAKHFLVGLVRCGSCGKNYIIQNKDGMPHSMRCRTRQNLKGCDNSHIVPKPVMDAIYRYTSARAANEAMTRQQMGVDEKEIAVQEGKLLELSRQFDNLAKTIRELGAEPEFMEAYKKAKAEREATENSLIILRSTVATPIGNYWREKGEVSDLERDDPQLLAAMLRTVDYSITVNLDGRITSSHSDVVYRYAGVDRRANQYKLMAGDKLILVLKERDANRLDTEKCDPIEPAEVGGESWMDEEDHENLRLQYE